MRPVIALIILFFGTLPVISQNDQCQPTVVAVTKEFEYAPIGVYNPVLNNVFLLWTKFVEPDRFTTQTSLHGRIVGFNGPLTVPRNYSFPPAEARFTQGSESVAYNSFRNEYLIVWQEIPEIGLGHRDGLYSRRVDVSGQPLGPIQKITSTYTFEPTIRYNTLQNEYLLTYGESLDSIRTARLDENAKLISQGDSFGDPSSFSDTWEAVIVLPDSFNYLILWHKGRILNTSGTRATTLMCQMVSKTGTVIGQSFAVLPEGPIAFGNPAAILNPRRREILALIAVNTTNTTTEIHSIRLGLDGKLRTQSMGIATVDFIYPPAIAWNSITGRYGLFYTRNQNLFFKELGFLGIPIKPEQRISCIERSRNGPGLLFDPSRNSYVAFWSHGNPKTRTDVYVRWIKAAP